MTVDKSPVWHVVYTRPNTERKILSKLERMGVETFLPLHKVVKRWSDRKKKMEVPLFPNYVFLKVNAITRAWAFSVDEIVRFVSIDRKPVIVADKELERLRHALNEDQDIVCYNYFQTGTRVRVIQGPLQGSEGIVIKSNNEVRVVIKIEVLMKAYAINLPAYQLENIQTHAE